VLTYYTKIKPNTPHAKTRDFVDKYIFFRNENKDYIYVSSVPDEIKDIESQVTRSYTIVEFMVFERIEDGRTKFTRVMQKNYNFSAKMQMIALNTNINNMVQKEKHMFTMVKHHILNL
jgi:hypothetical protein